MGENRQILLARRPRGGPVMEDFEVSSGAVPAPREGEVLLRHLILSIDPAIRGWMADKKSYLPPIELGAPVRSGTLSQVVQSRDPRVSVGSIVQALGAWEEYSAVPGDAVMGRVERLPGIPLEAHLSVLGGTGLTAYFGLLEIGQPREGETVLVSAAAGGVGSIVGQIAKIRGCRVVGIAGGAAKCRWLVDELGFDAAIDYKGEDVRAALDEAAPKGVDVYFDSVGGELLELALTRLRNYGRVVLCGAISQIHEDELPPGPRSYVHLIAKRGRMQGFVTLDYAARYDEARAQLAAWIREGKLRFRDEIASGIEEAPRHFLRLFDGSHRGKLMVKLAEPQDLGLEER
jgi:NADPH-dependent curcumin reductase